jgi:hypothetical protein
VLEPHEPPSKALTVITSHQSTSSKIPFASSSKDDIDDSNSDFVEDFCINSGRCSSTCAASKVLDAVKKFSSKLQLEEVPRCSSWPLQFQYSHPSDENIALYFFAKDHESYGKSYRLLLEHVLKNDFAL